MSDEYEFYQGLVLRHLVVNSELSLFLRPFVREGRINAFAINGRVGIFMKHSAKRLSPWRFTFTIEQAADLLDLESKLPESFAVFVCGDDGLVTIDIANLHGIVSFQETEHAWVRIERSPRSQYAVAGNRAQLPYKVANGTAQIHQLLYPTRNRAAS